MGMFYPFLEDTSVRLVGVEAGGDGVATGRHAAPLNDGVVGVLHGNRTYLMQDEDGLIKETHSVSLVWTIQALDRARMAQRGVARRVRRSNG